MIKLYRLDRISITTNRCAMSLRKEYVSIESGIAIRTRRKFQPHKMPMGH